LSTAGRREAMGHSKRKMENLVRYRRLELIFRGFADQSESSQTGAVHLLRTRLRGSGKVDQDSLPRSAMRGDAKSREAMSLSPMPKHPRRHSQSDRGSCLRAASIEFSRHDKRSHTSTPSAPELAVTLTRDSSPTISCDCHFGLVPQTYDLLRLSGGDDGARTRDLCRDSFANNRKL